MKPLDFLIIGAQKSGTTSLFKYLNQHPDIAMPADKEAPYFTNDELYSAGWQHYLGNYFTGYDQELLWGTASPQYMSDLRAAERITRDLPNTRLIAILRNPIERAYSHYLMQKRRGLLRGVRIVFCSSSACRDRRRSGLFKERLAVSSQ